MSAPTLERRYRRLLALVSRGRTAASTRRRCSRSWSPAPGPASAGRPSGEAANLRRVRLARPRRAAVTALAAPAWRDAAAVFGLLAALVLLSQRVVRLFDPYGGADATQ